MHARLLLNARVELEGKLVTLLWDGGANDTRALHTDVTAAKATKGERAKRKKRRKWHVEALEQVQGRARTRNATHTHTHTHTE